MTMCPPKICRSREISNSSSTLQNVVRALSHKFRVSIEIRNNIGNVALLRFQLVRELLVSEQMGSVYCQALNF